MRSVGSLLLVIATTVALVPPLPSARAESTPNARPAVAAGPSGPYEQTLIRRSGGPAMPPATRGSGSSPSPAGAAWNIGNVTIALGGVILLIVALRWVAKSVLAGAGSHRTCRAVQVLACSTVAPRQQLMLLQVGRRLVLVGTAGAEMSPLCEIREADEVAEVLGQIRGEKQAPARSFKALFGRAERQFDPHEGANDEAEAVCDDDGSRESASTAETRAELSGLIERVRSMTGQFQS